MRNFRLQRKWAAIGSEVVKYTVSLRCGYKAAPSGSMPPRTTCRTAVSRVFVSLNTSPIHASGFGLEWVAGKTPRRVAKASHQGTRRRR